MRWAWPWQSGSGSGGCRRKWAALPLGARVPCEIKWLNLTSTKRWVFVHTDVSGKEKDLKENSLLLIGGDNILAEIFLLGSLSLLDFISFCNNFFSINWNTNRYFVSWKLFESWNVKLLTIFCQFNNKVFVLVKIRFKVHLPQSQ